MPDGEITEQHGTPILKMELPTNKSKQKILFLGDLHWDHPTCDRATLKRLLDDAVNQDAWIVLVGDVLCTMQGRKDGRHSKGDVRPEHMVEDYFGAVIDTAIDWFTPYARNIWIMLEGNHESAIRKHNEIDLVRQLSRGLNDRTGSSIVYPGYSTYALAQVVSNGTRRTGHAFWLAHGHGGGGEVTKGTIQAQRRAVTYPDAEYVVSGHIHSSYFVAHEQWRITRSGRAYATEQQHYVVNTFKQEFKRGRGGFHVERGRGPRIPSGWMSEWFNFKDDVRSRWYRVT